MQEALDEGFPTDIEEKEAYFLQQISQGEAMANDGMFWYLCIASKLTPAKALIQ